MQQSVDRMHVLYFILVAAKGSDLTPRVGYDKQQGAHRTPNPGGPNKLLVITQRADSSRYLRLSASERACGTPRKARGGNGDIVDFGLFLQGGM